MRPRALTRITVGAAIALAMTPLHPWVASGAVVDASTGILGDVAGCVNRVVSTAIVRVPYSLVDTDELRPGDPSRSAKSIKAPSAPTLHAPQDGSTVTTLTPALTVVNVPHGAEEVFQYRFELYGSASLGEESFIGSSMIEEGTALTQWVVDPLEDQQTYYWRALADDGLQSGPWMDLASFTVSLVNQVPTVPRLFGPEGEVTTRWPEFSWYNSVDPDGDVVSYRLEIFYNAELTERERVVADIPQGDTLTRYTIESELPLQDDTDYFWRVIASDARRGSSDPSAAKAITVDTFNSPPPAPVIVAPLDGSPVASEHPQLVVAPVTDADGDPLTYAFAVSQGRDFGEIVDRAGEVLPSSGDGLVHYEVIQTLGENQWYSWRSAARDQHGLGQFVQGSFFVDVQNEPPSVPAFQSPSDGQVLTTTTPVLVIRNALDPEGDTVTYDVEIYEDEVLSILAFSAYGVDETQGGETQVEVDEPLANGVTHHARARSVDVDGALSDWSDTVAFTIQVGSATPPGAPVPLTPPNGSQVSSDHVVLEVVNSRDSSTRTRTYEFEIFRDVMLDDRVYRSEGIEEGASGTTAHQVTIELGAGQYYWHARADNGQQVSSWSVTWLFHVVQVDDVGVAEPSPDAVEDDMAPAEEVEPMPEEGCGCGAMGGGSAKAFLLFALLLVPALRSRPFRT